ncbi:MAG: cytochrome c3 family protein [Planctomycetota bacterium]|jgi:predicted CXXCH cytochrome family protein
MKSVIRFVPVVLVGVLATAAFGQITPGDPSSYPSVSVVNTPHNLNNYPGVSIPGNQVCLPCHTPHNALLYGEENVLWNHAETGETFTMYYSTGVGQPEGPSKMCLSCHDGVTAVDNYGGNGGTGIVITGSAALDNDLSNDHPIGIEYPTDRPAEYNDPTTFDPGINSGPGVRLVEIGGVERVECTSCHEPHNNGLGAFLRVPLQESYICLQCHIK